MIADIADNTSIEISRDGNTISISFTGPGARTTLSTEMTVALSEDLIELVLAAAAARRTSVSISLAGRDEVVMDCRTAIRLAEQLEAIAKGSP